LEGSSASRFEFKAQIESPTLYPKNGQLRSRMDAGALIITLYGEWKIGSNLGLSFQMDYGQGRVKAIEFGAVVSFGRNKVNFALKNELGQPLRVTLTMIHKFLKTIATEAFIRLKSLKKNKR
jgi:hypothetical protein